MGLAADRISSHEVRLLLLFKTQPERWLTNTEAAEAAGISPRTARLHTSRLVDLERRVVQGGLDAFVEREGLGGHVCSCDWRSGTGSLCHWLIHRRFSAIGYWRFVFLPVPRPQFLIPIGHIR